MPETAEVSAADGKLRKTRRTKTKKSIWIDKDMPLTPSKYHVGASGRSVAESWEAISYYLKFYQTDVTGRVEKLVGETSKLYAYGDRKIREVAMNSGLKRAFERMEGRVESRRKKAGGDRHPDPFSLASMRTLVTTQNRFVKDELATMLGIVDSARLELVLSSGAALRYKTGLDAALEEADVATVLSNNTTPKPIDFSDASDGRWEAELERARQEAELTRAREIAEAKALIAGAEGWMSDVHVALGGRSGGGGGDDPPPPPLVSDSESESGSDVDGGGGGGGGGVQAIDPPGGGAKAAVAGAEDDGASSTVVAWDDEPDEGKAGGGTTKRRVSGKKGRGNVIGGSKPALLPEVEVVGTATLVGTVVSNAAPDCAAPAENGGLNHAAATDIASTVVVVADASPADAHTTGMVGGPEESGRGDQTRGTRVRSVGGTSADMEDYMIIEDWVNGVAAGRVKPRAAQLQRYFRDRLDKSVISMLIEHYRGDVRGAVIALAGMLDPPITGAASEHEERSTIPGATGGAVDAGAGAGAGGVAAATVEAGRHGVNDNDVDEHDLNAIVSRANYLVDTGCQDVERLQALLDKAKGKEGIKVVRKKLAKAIKALKQQQQQQQDEEAMALAVAEQTAAVAAAMSEGDADLGNTTSVAPGGPSSSSAAVGGTGAAGRTSNGDATGNGGWVAGTRGRHGGSGTALISDNMDVDDMEVGCGDSDAEDSDEHDDVVMEVSDRGAAGDNDKLIRQVESLVANGCRDVKKLKSMLWRAKGKPGLDKTRKLLRKAIKECDNGQDGQPMPVAAAGVAATGKASRTKPTPAHTSTTTKNKNKNITSNGKGKGNDPRPQSSPLLEISGTVAKQLDRQRRAWPAGHVRQTLRCRPNLIQRVIGRNGVGVNSIVEKTGAKVNVLTDVSNGRLYRTITVRGVPKSVAHAVRLLCEVIGESVIVGEVEQRYGARQQASGAVKPPTPYATRGGKGNDGNEAADANTDNTNAKPDAVTTNNNNNNNNNNKRNNMKSNKNTSQNDTDKLPMDTKHPATGDGENRYDGARASTKDNGGVSTDADGAVNFGAAAAGDAGLPASGSGGGDAKLDSGFDQGVDGTWGGGDNGNTEGRGQSRAAPRRSTLHNNPDAQDTADMIERLHAGHRGGGRGGHVSRDPAPRQHPVDASPACVAAAAGGFADSSGENDRENVGGVGYGTAGTATGAHGLPGLGGEGVNRFTGIGANGGVKGFGGAAGVPRGAPPGFSDVGVGAGAYASEAAPPPAAYNGANTTTAGFAYMPSTAAAATGAAGFSAATPAYLYAGGATLPGSCAAANGLGPVAAATVAQAMAAYPYAFSGHPGMNNMNAAAAAMGFVGRAPVPAAGVGGAAAAPAVAGYPLMAPVPSVSAGVLGMPADPAAPAGPPPANGVGADGGQRSVNNDAGPTLETDIQPDAPGIKKSTKHLSQAAPTGPEGFRGACGGGGDGGGGGGGITSEAGAKAGGGATTTVRPPDPHVKAVLRAAGCEKFLPLFMARQIDLQKLFTLGDEVFEMLKDDNDPSTTVAKGPQVKIKHHCKRKMEELGLDVGSKADDGKTGAGGGDDEGKNDETGSEDTCHVCRAGEIKIIFVPCGHKVCCIKCGKATAGRPCPICRVKVDEAVCFFAG